jgi:hypothetical protein
MVAAVVAITAGVLAGVVPAKAAPPRVIPASRVRVRMFERI